MERDHPGTGRNGWDGSSRGGASARLAADGQLPADGASELLLVGELRPVRGAISLAMLARSMDRTLMLPASCAGLAALVPGARVCAANDLAVVRAHVRGERPLPATQPSAAPAREEGVVLAEVRGQEHARWALEIAAAGQRHLLLWGPPGCGKRVGLGSGLCRASCRASRLRGRGPWGRWCRTWGLPTSLRAEALCGTRGGCQRGQSLEVPSA